MIIMELLDEQLRRQSRRAAERVVNHDDILNTEYIIHGRHGFQSEGGAPTCVSLGKDCPRVANTIAGFVEDVLTRIDLVAKIFGDGLWDFGRSRVKIFKRPPTAYAKISGRSLLYLGWRQPLIGLRFNFFPRAAGADRIGGYRPESGLPLPPPKNASHSR